MEYVRDLGQVQPWEESLRRSLERRNKPRRSSVELHRLRPTRDLTLGDVLERSAAYSELRRRAVARSAMPGPSVAIGGVSALALAAAATLPSLWSGRSAAAVRKHTALIADTAAPATPATRSSAVPASHRSQLAYWRRNVSPSSPRVPTHVTVRPAPHATPAEADTSAARPTHTTVATTRQPVASVASVTTRSGGASITAARRHAVVHHPASTSATTPAPTVKAHHGAGGVGVKPITTAKKTAPASSPTVAPPVASGGYVNPFAGASVTPERIDQGVDYSGSGTLTALGSGVVTYSSTSGTGWPGAFVEYRLSSGADAGRYVYYAEGLTPLVRTGAAVRPGEPVARLVPGYSSGIEVGWGSGVGSQTYAEQHGEWTGYDDAHDVPSLAGQSFSQLIKSLGGPAGKVEG